MKRLRVLFVNVGLRTFSNFWAIPPMGILALAAYVREKLGAEVAVINQRLDNCTAKDIARRARELDANVVGLSAMTTTACLLPEIVSAIRAETPNAFIVLGGPYITPGDTGTLEASGADAAVPGEGELTLERMLRAHSDGSGDLSGIPGILWRDSQNEVIVNPGQTPFVEDLDTLPLPAYDLINLKSYWHRKTSVPVIWRRYATLFTSRGCSFQCIWCHKIFGTKVRMHSPERVLEEMKTLSNAYGVVDFDIQDDTFNYSAERVLQICDGVLQQGKRFKLALPNGVRGDILTPTAIDALADAGLYMCMFALESGSEKIQKWTRKHLNIPRYLDACSRMAARRVFIQTCCMMGFPTETEADLDMTIKMAAESQAHTASFFIATPYPGTPLYDWVKANCPEKLQGLDYDLRNSSTMRVNLSDMPDDVLFEYQRKAVRHFFARPGRIYRILRDHPQRLALPLYVPIVGYRMLKSFTNRKA